MNPASKYVDVFESYDRFEEDNEEDLSDLFLNHPNAPDSLELNL